MFLEIFAKFTAKHLCHSLFFNKVTGFRPATLLRKRLWHRCFLVHFPKFLRTPFLQNNSGSLPLKQIVSITAHFRGFNCHFRFHLLLRFTRSKSKNLEKKSVKQVNLVNPKYNFMNFNLLCKSL